MSIADTDDAVLAALRAKHGRVKRVSYNGHDLVFRKPTRLEILHHSQMLQDPQQKLTADEELAVALIVRIDGVEGSPGAPGASREAFRSLIEEYPHVVSCAEVARALQMLSGIVQDDEAKNSGNRSTGSASSQPISAPA